MIKFKDSEFYKYGSIVLAVIATCFIAVETTTIAQSYKNYTLFFEYVIFGLLFLDLAFNTITYKRDVIKLKYILTFEGIIDVLASLPLLFIWIENPVLNQFKIVLGIASFLKIARFSDALSIFKDVIISERKSILASLYLMLLLTFVISTLLYFVEKDANPKGFSSIIESMWWSVVTLATVGYGDVVPITVLGKFIGAIASIVGLGMFALPAGILANGFAQELARIKYITSWNLVSKVPIFAKLDKSTISEIAKLLTIKRFSKNELIIKFGDSGDTMYFILDGEVEVDIVDKNKVILLKNEDFFGEIALLKDVKRTATVIAKKRCEMLELSAYDLKKLIRYRPEIISKIEETAKSRIDFEEDN